MFLEDPLDTFGRKKKPSLAFHRQVNQGGLHFIYQGRRNSERSPWQERSLQILPLQSKLNLRADIMTSVPFSPDPFCSIPDLVIFVLVIFVIVIFVIVIFVSAVELVVRSLRSDQELLGWGH